MANGLKPKLALVKLYDEAKIIRVKDVTGAYDAVDNIGGYGAPNLATSEVEAIVFTVNKEKAKDGVSSVRFNKTFDPLHPEYLVIPTATQIASGVEVEIDSYKLGDSQSTQDFFQFKEGVIDINYYVCGASINVSGVKDTKFVNVLFDPTDILTKCDSVVIGKEVYQIDKTKGSDEGTKIFFTTNLKENVTSMLPSYRGNLKLLNTFHSKCSLWKSAKILSNGNKSERILDREQGVLKIIHNLKASELLWEKMDYITVDKLLNENYFIGKKILGLC